MMEKQQAIIAELKKVISGKDAVLAKVLMAFLAQGHVLLEDIPGVGKTTLALGFSKSMGLDYKRVQCTPDVIPSDIVGFTIYNKDTGMLEYKEGAIMCNLFLADEINRTSSKTQSALLEVMQEGNVTVDGTTYPVPKPFSVIATQNPMGSAGTQMLPEAQLDRFMISLQMGYPDFESQIDIFKNRQKSDPLEKVEQVVTCEELIAMQKEVNDIYLNDEMLAYITRLMEATRAHEWVRLGVSPRGGLSLYSMAKAHAYFNNRDYVIPEDVMEVFVDVCKHRLVLNSKARVNNTTPADILRQILKETETPAYE